MQRQKKQGVASTRPSELDFQAELQNARRAIGGGDPSEIPVSNCRSRKPEVRVIKEVEKLAPEQHPQPFPEAQGKRARDAQVRIAVAWSSQYVSAQRSERPCHGLRHSGSIEVLRDLGAAAAACHRQAAGQVGESVATSRACCAVAGAEYSERAARLHSNDAGHLPVGEDRDE